MIAHADPAVPIPSGFIRCAAIQPTIAVLVTKKDLLDEMVEKGELTVEQGKVLNEELKHNVKKTVKEKVNALKPASAEELSDLLDKMTPEQIAALKEQILKKEEASETAPDEA